jgi:hypothetical protein
VADAVSDTPFSHTYAEARQRFKQAACAAGAAQYAYAIDTSAANPLTIDVAILGGETDPALVISSGVHGIEGFLGSAVQLAVLERLAALPRLRYVLLHGVNPYGFAHLRRVNENNVDVNRNFAMDSSGYAGAPRGYADLNELLNPSSAPARFDPFRLQALWHIARTGLPALKQSVAGGQYEYPRGLFYGGKEPSASARIVQSHCDAWMAASPRILHIDLHTGLGAFAQPTLLLNEAADSPHCAWYAQTFTAHRIEPLAQSRGTAYQASGLFGLWMQRHFHRQAYRFVGAEFGTYQVIRVLAALRAENRAHHHCAADSTAYAHAKRELFECFCPASSTWRRQAVEAALRIVDQGAQALAALPA